MVESFASGLQKTPIPDHNGLTAMHKDQLNKAPILVIAIVIIAAFFLSCTKKPKQASNVTPNGYRAPASPQMYTTPHGFKVEFEQTPAANKVKQ
jgi:hypothetical protein